MKSECAKCGLVFTSVTAFDMHRVGGYGDPIYEKSTLVGYTKSTRRCLTEEEIIAKGMIKTAKGWWSTGRMQDFKKSEDSEQPDEESEQAVS